MKISYPGTLPLLKLERPKAADPLDAWFHPAGAESQDQSGAKLPAETYADVRVMRPNPNPVIISTGGRACGKTINAAAPKPVHTCVAEQSKPSDAAAPNTINFCGVPMPVVAAPFIPKAGERVQVWDINDIPIAEGTFVMMTMGGFYRVRMDSGITTLWEHCKPLAPAVGEWIEWKGGRERPVSLDKAFEFKWRGRGEKIFRSEVGQGDVKTGMYEYSGVTHYRLAP